MKYIIILSILALSCSTKKKVLLRYPDKSIEEKMINNVNLELERRLSYCYENFRFNYNSRRKEIKMKIPDRYDYENTYKTLFGVGRIDLRENYLNEELYIKLLSNDSLINYENPRVDSFQSANIFYPNLNKEGEARQGAILGYSQPTDTFLVNKLLRSSLKNGVFQDSISFKWGLPTFDNHLELYAVKQTSIIPEKFRNMIDEVMVKQIESGYFEIELTFKESYHDFWQKYTSKKTGRYVSFLIDNTIYIAALIPSEMPGGKVSIRGNFSKEKANVIYALIKSKEIPINLEIVSEK